MNIWVSYIYRNFRLIYSFDSYAQWFPRTYRKILKNSTRRWPTWILSRNILNIFHWNRDSNYVLLIHEYVPIMIGINEMLREENKFRRIEQIGSARTSFWNKTRLLYGYVFCFFLCVSLCTVNIHFTHELYIYAIYGMVHNVGM